MAVFRFEFMASDHVVYSGDAVSVVIPTTEGKAGILAHHSNVIMAIVPGVVEFVPAADGEGAQGERRIVVVSDGMIKVENNEVILLVDSAENPEDIDVNRAKRAADRARKELDKQRSRRELAAMDAELSRALNRLRVTSKHHLQK